MSQYWISREVVERLWHLIVTQRAGPGGQSTLFHNSCGRKAIHYFVNLIDVPAHAIDQDHVALFDSFDIFKLTKFLEIKLNLTLFRSFLRVS